MSSSKRCRGITISVTAETNAGGRRHMEDYLAVNLAPNEDSRNGQVAHLREQAFIGVFDGHGGKEAAKCVRERLWEVIQRQPKYQSYDLNCVLESIKDAYIAMHKEMEPLRETWKRNKMGDLSTAGTTASTVIFRQDHIIVANVGDSTAVLAVSNPQAGEEGQHPVLARALTIDHKPEDPTETARIEKRGGKVMLSRKGVPRIVWRRERRQPKDNHVPDDTPTQFDSIPFLSVARSLGDFWSYSSAANEFAVSPCPDIHCFPLSPKEQKFIVVASDGLWNVMSPKQVVEFIHDYENNDQTCHQPKDVVKAVINEALHRWKLKNLLADNIAVLIAFLTEEEYTYTPVPSSTSASSSISSPTSLPKDPPHLKVIASSPTENSMTEDTREDLSSPSSNKAETKLKHNRQRNISSPPTRLGLRSKTVSESPEFSCSTLGKRQVQADSSEASDVKRMKMDNLDSGLDVDSNTDTEHNIASETESHTPVDCSNESTSSVPPVDIHLKTASDSVDREQTKDTNMEVVDVNITADQSDIPFRPTCSKFDEDSSSGVSSDDNSIGHVLKRTSNVSCSGCVNSPDNAIE